MLGRWFDETRRGASQRKGRVVVVVASLWAMLVMAGCGDEASPPAAGDAGLDGAAECTPRLPPGWAPQWRPPRPPTPNACSEEQIQREYAACEGPMATTATCAPFRNDPANTGCIACLFSSERDPSYGAIIRVGGSWKTNTAGCIALVDGDNTSSGCGARVQAASACYDAACDGCEPFTSYLQCREQAPTTACRSHYLAAVCLLRPVYSTCTAYAITEDYFVAAARLFCGPVSPAGSGRAKEGSQ